MSFLIEVLIEYSNIRFISNQNRGLQSTSRLTPRSVLHIVAMCMYETDGVMVMACTGHTHYNQAQWDRGHLLIARMKHRHEARENNYAHQISEQYMKNR